MRNLFAAATTAVLLLAMPARAGCWKADEAGAATVRELQSMLMVAALRCQVAHHDITGDYNAFVQANRATIGRMNDRLKAHFIRQAGPVDGQTAYDSFTTTLANGYGAAASGAEACATMGSLAREAALMAGSAEGLLLLSDRAGIGAVRAEGLCDATPMTVAIAAQALPAPIATAVETSPFVVAYGTEDGLPPR